MCILIVYSIFDSVSGIDNQPPADRTESVNNGTSDQSEILGIIAKGDGWGYMAHVAAIMLHSLDTLSDNSGALSSDSFHGSRSRPDRIRSALVSAKCQFLSEWYQITIKRSELWLYDSIWTARNNGRPLLTSENDERSYTLNSNKTKLLTET